MSSQRFSATLGTMRHATASAMSFLLFVTLLPAAETGRPTTVERYYRADANIMLFGITIFSRSDVGGGFARIVETNGPAGGVRLLFVSGSRPDRAHGLNRMGYIEETIGEGRAARAEYLGFMTASGEESLADAKKALHGPAAGQVEFVASRGEIDDTSARSTVRHMPLPSSARWTDAPRLLETVQEDLSKPGGGFAQADLSRGDRPGTFLYTVLSMVRSTARANDGSFVHNGKLFRLHAVKRPDAKAGAQFTQAHLIASPNNAVELSGLIRNAKTGVETTFRVWFDRTSPNSLPLRFEFQPKSYLKLVFEAQPATDPAMVRVFAEPAPIPPGAASNPFRTAFRQ